MQADCHCGHPHSEHRISAYGSPTVICCTGQKDYGAGIEDCCCVRWLSLANVPADVQPFPGQPLHPQAAARLL